MFSTLQFRFILLREPNFVRFVRERLLRRLLHAVNSISGEQHYPRTFYRVKTSQLLLLSTSENLQTRKFMAVFSKGTQLWW